MLLLVRTRKHYYVNNMSLILHYDAISSTNTIARALKNILILLLYLQIHKNPDLEEMVNHGLEIHIRIYT